MASAACPLNELEKALGYKFTERQLLEQALTRRSFANNYVRPHPMAPARLRNNEELEFLGDRVLNLVVADFLRLYHTGWNEGELTSESQKFVSNSLLSKTAAAIQLGRHLKMDEGERCNNFGEQNPRILADSFEALVGAIYVDANRSLKVIGQLLHKLWPSFGELFGLLNQLHVAVEEREVEEVEELESRILQAVKMGASLSVQDDAGKTIFHYLTFSNNLVRSLLEGEKNWSGINFASGGPLPATVFEGYEYATNDVYYASTDFVGVNFQASNLSNLDLSGRVCEGVDFSNTVLVNVNFSRVRFRNVTFNNANVTRANFHGSTMDSSSRRSFVKLLHGIVSGDVGVDEAEFWNMIGENDLRKLKDLLDDNLVSKRLKSDLIRKVDRANMTSLHIASSKGYEEMVTILLNLGADPLRRVEACPWVDPRDTFSDASMRLITQRCMMVGTRSVIHATATDLARAAGHEQIVKLLAGK